MSKLTEEQALDALRHIDAPKTETNIVDAGLIHDVEITGDTISFSLEMNTDAPNLFSAIAMSAKVALKVAGWDGAVRIKARAVKPPASNGGGQPHKARTGPQGPPKAAPKPQQTIAAKGSPGLPVIGKKPTDAPKRTSKGLPVIGQKSGAAATSAPAPPKRGPKGLPVVGGAGPQSSAEQGPRRSPIGGEDNPLAKRTLPGVKYIIVVASGKGGVGKSTVATNLAAALVQLGYKTGLLDNDVYGPSAPVMMGIHEQPEVSDKKLVPIERYGIKVMSLGFLLDEGSPVIWRGPIVLQVTNQLYFDVQWGELDYLICDLPPGTGDVQLTIAQKVPVTGAVIVTTPQDVALADVERGLKMFQKVDVPVLGVVENMATYLCPHCGEETPIFGRGGGKAKAKELNLPLLAEIPIDLAIREWADKGKPVVLALPDSSAAKSFMDLAEVLVELVEGKDKKKEGGLARLTKRVLKIIQ